LIPEDYLPDVHTRLIMYKRISSANNQEELEDLQVEMIDRFGLLPQPLKLLFRTTRLKLKAQNFGIRKIDANVSSGRIEFSASTLVDPISLVQLIQDDPQHFKLGSANQLQFTHGRSDAGDKLDFIEELLRQFKLVEQKAA
jgi:transcription-repair coupling factor (superfamily II helicase)